jgi:hypothetical protein
VRTTENSSIDWISIGDEITKTLKPIRQIAREYGVSDTAVRKVMEKRNWTRPQQPEAPEPARDLARQQRQAAKAIASAPIADLTARGRGIILDLMAELEFLNRNHQTLASMVEDYVSGASDATVRAKLIKALDHETRSKTANYLATALAKLGDVSPGKKEQAEADAKTAGVGSEWEADLQFVPLKTAN